MNSKRTSGVRSKIRTACAPETVLLLTGTLMALSGCERPGETDDPPDQLATAVQEEGGWNAVKAGLTLAQATDLEDRINVQLATTPGGVRVGLNEVAWEDGNVVMTFGLPDGIGALAHGPCDPGWYCVYEAWYWNERDIGQNYRKLRFRDCRPWGYVNFLRSYNFHDKTSSWDNRSNRRVKVLDDGTGFLWNMDPHSRSPEVPANDMADKLDAYCP
jgi:hypothetical protein